MTAEILIRPLARDDDRTAFRSGNIELDRFFQRYAGQNQFRHHIGSTYGAVAGEAVLGFVTVSPGELTSEQVQAQIRKRLPQYPLPVLRISRLAVDERVQGRGIGKALLRFALRLGIELRERYGCVGIVVDAKSGAVRFYGTLGFRPLEAVRGGLGDRPEPTPMFLPIAQAVAAGS